MRAYLLAALMVLAAVAPGWRAGAATNLINDQGFLGKWDITATGTKSGMPRICWLELRHEQGVLKGRFNAGGGSQFDLPQVAAGNGQLMFQYKDGNPPMQEVWKGALKNGNLVGTAEFRGQTLTWTGVRAPEWPATPPTRKPGKPIDLFNGKDVSGWLCQNPNQPMRWFVKDGILQNEGERACNIYSKQKFTDFHLEVEFNVAPHSNSGVYLRGRDEIQVLDGYDQKIDVHSQGALYGFIAPSVKADKPAGQWQTFDVTLIANRLTVLMNGTKIIDNAQVPGLTGGALDADEEGPGPIMLQGDHGKVEFRKVRITPLI